MRAKGTLKVLSVPKSELRALHPSGSSSSAPSNCSWSKVAAATEGVLADSSDQECGRFGRRWSPITCPGLPLLPMGLFCPHSPPPHPIHTLFWGREFSRVWTLGLRGPPPTLGSRSFQLLALSCCSSRNLRVTSSIESCRRSQKPARSWKVGTGNAVGSCRGRRQKRGRQGDLSPSQDQRAPPGTREPHPPSLSGSQP